MNTPLVSVIMRSYNEAWALEGTLPALKAQSHSNWELIVIDSGSTDASQEMIRAMQPAHFVQITPQEYNPSRVMNHGMRLAKAETCLFLNADATPQGNEWLPRLAAPLARPQMAAVFGCQIPRPNCEAVYACDYERCFGLHRESASWEHFFSMVSSGLRRDVWALRGFREDLQYAEDDEYTRWCRAQGYEIGYVPEAVVMHSHNYSVEQARRRSFGDARAIARAWSKPPPGIDWWRIVFRGWCSDVQHDLKFYIRNHRTRELFHAARVRWAQRQGKLAGYRQGWKEISSEQP